MKKHIQEAQRHSTHADGRTGVWTRRSLLFTGASAVAAASLRSAAQEPSRAKPGSFLDLLRLPDEVTAYSGFTKTMPTGRSNLARVAEQWRRGELLVETKVQPNALQLTLASPATPVAVVHVRWQTQVVPGMRALGDAWERSYGELGWRDLIPERVMPWYFATHDGVACHGYGVKTDAAALCFWQMDPEGVSLWLNVTNGGDGVVLGPRKLIMATVATRHGVEGEASSEAVAQLCRTLCARVSRPAQPVYGSNDWCYSYGRSTAETILRDTEFIVELSPSGGARPFSVIDEGYFNGTPAWPDMAGLAATMKQHTARPGIWIRPLRVAKDASHVGLLPDARFGDKKDRARELAYDPTHPEAQERIRARVREVTEWGYELVKHDFSSYDLLGQWGFEMGPQPTLPGWSLHDRTRTNAEVITDLYAMIRDTAGAHILLDGCNTLGHLGQGLFDIQRTGDDTSGRQWERTRRMGVNTLAFRLPQNGIFYTVDADLVGITEDVPWVFNQQWLDVLARSGAATMVSAGPPSRGAEQRAALRDAFQMAASGGTGARPVDWMETSAPERWQPRGAGTETRYRWSGQQGASPFLSP